MSDGRAAESRTLSWRGPLLAAAIFAVVFAVLLLMAHQNQSNTSDMGSSLREDPYGTSLLFNSYARAGYQVERREDEDSLADMDAPRTTAFFVGGAPSTDWQVENGKLEIGGGFVERIEGFLARGGRVVLVRPWGLGLKSASQGWNLQMDWDETPHNAGAIWAEPLSPSVPPGSERMYLTQEAPSLKTDGHWTPLYSRPAGSGGSPGRARVYMAMRHVGKGELVAASQESFLLNEAIKTHPNPVLLDFLAGDRPVIWVDETLHGLYQDEGVLWLVSRYRLQVALLLFWASLLALLWSLGGDLLRRPPRESTAAIVREGEAAGTSAQRLLQRSVPAEQLVAECWDQFRRRSPQDAQAISRDPRWRPRLLAALSGAPVAGYRELKQLIGERRGERRWAQMGPASAATEASRVRGASPKPIIEEARVE